MTDEPKRAKGGRPRRHKEGALRPTMAFRLNTDLHERLKLASERSQRSLSEEIERRVEQSFLMEDVDRAIREQIRQEMRAEFAAREAARKAAREAERERLMKSATIYGGANQGQQWAAAAINQFSGQDWMALKTEPEKA